MRRAPDKIRGSDVYRGFPSRLSRCLFLASFYFKILAVRPRANSRSLFMNMLIIARFRQNAADNGEASFSRVCKNYKNRWGASGVRLARSELANAQTYHFCQSYLALPRSDTLQERNFVRASRWNARELTANAFSRYFKPFLHAVRRLKNVMQPFNLRHRKLLRRMPKWMTNQKRW